MDRWSQLSMSEKSDLMSLYIKNGISSLEEIKKHYNSFAEGGHLYRDGGPDEPQITDIQDNPVRNAEQKDWFDNWYANRTQQLNNHFANFNKFNFGYDITKNKTPQSYIFDAVNTSVNVPVYNKFSFNWAGLHGWDENGERIYLNPIPVGGNKESTLLHERAHAINFNLPKTPTTGGLYSPIELDIYNRNKDYYDNDIKQNGEIFYYNEPGEIYSRLMQFRYDKNIDPTHKWTEDEINNLRKEGFMGIGNSLKKFDLDQYPNSFLLYLFNDVAENKTSEENVHYAALGGKLGKVTPYGQWQYPHQVTTIPSNNITMKGVDYPVIGVSNTGDTKYMLPNMDYLFDGQYVTEYPVKRK